MKKQSVFILFVFVLGITNTQAQFGKSLLDAAGRGAANALNKKIEKKTEEAVDKKIEESLPKDTVIQSKDSEAVVKKSSEGTNKWAQFSQSLNATTEESYSFQTVIETEVKSDKDAPVSMKMLFNTTLPYMGIKMNDSLTMVYDLKNNSMATFSVTSEGKTFFALNLSGIKADKSAASSEDASKIKLTKTTQTKMIAGYKSFLYKVESPEFNGDYWVSPDLKIKTADFNKYLGQSNPGYAAGSSLDGYLMQMDGTNKEGKKISSLVKSVNLTAKIQLAKKDYQGQK